MTKTTDAIHQALDSELATEDLYPIREVSRLTGVNPVTLRAWERRYGLLIPHRTESGHRLYSMADIERVRKVTGWIDRGVAVSKVASIIDREVSASQAPAAVTDDAAARSMAGFRDWQAKLVDAVNSGDLTRLDAVYGQVHSTFALATVLRDIALPVWKLFRDSTAPGETSAQWSFLDAFLRGRLFQRIGYPRPGLPTVLLAVMPSPTAGPELEVLCAAALVAEAEANISFVPGLSSYAELTAIAEYSSCDLLVLYGDRAQESDVMNKSLPRMEQAVACQVAAVGPVCEAQPRELQQAGITVLGTDGTDLIARVRGLLLGRLDPK